MTISGNRRGLTQEPLAWSASSRNLDDNDPRGQRRETKTSGSSGVIQSFKPSLKPPPPKEPLLDSTEMDSESGTIIEEEIGQSSEQEQREKRSAKKRSRDSQTQHDSSASSLYHTQQEALNGARECSQPPLLKRHSASFYTVNESHQAEFVRQTSGRTLVLPSDLDSSCHERDGQVIASLEDILRSCSPSWIRNETAIKPLYPMELLTELENMADVEIDPSLLLVGQGSHQGNKNTTDLLADDAREEVYLIPLGDREDHPAASSERVPTPPAGPWTGHPMELVEEEVVKASDEPLNEQGFTAIQASLMEYSVSENDPDMKESRSSSPQQSVESSVCSSVRRVSLSTGDALFEEEEAQGNSHSLPSFHHHAPKSPVATIVAPVPTRSPASSSPNTLASLESPKSFKHQDSLARFLHKKEATTSKLSGIVRSKPSQRVSASMQGDFRNVSALTAQQPSIRGQGAILPPSMNIGRKGMLPAAPLSGSTTSNPLTSSSRMMSFGSRAPPPPFSSTKQSQGVPSAAGPSAPKDLNKAAKLQRARVMPREIDLASTSSSSKPRPSMKNVSTIADEPRPLNRDMISKILKTNTVRRSNVVTPASKDIQFQAPSSSLPRLQAAPALEVPSTGKDVDLAYLDRHEPPPFRSPGIGHRKYSSKKQGRSNEAKAREGLSRSGHSSGEELHIPSSFTSSASSSRTGDGLLALRGDNRLEGRTSNNLDNTMHRTGTIERTPLSSTTSSSPNTDSLSSYFRPDQRVSGTSHSALEVAVDSSREIQLNGLQHKSSASSENVMEFPAQRQSIEPLVRTPHKRGSDLFTSSFNPTLPRPQGNVEAPGFSQGSGVGPSPHLKQYKEILEEYEALKQEQDLPMNEVQVRRNLEPQVSILSMSSLSDQQDRFMNEKIFS